MKNIHSIRDLRIANQRVFMRVDFNVPLSEPDAEGQRKILEDNRIQESIPCIKYALENGARLILASHLGRPDGKVSPEYSLEPIAAYLAEALGVEVLLAEDYLSEGFELLVQTMKPGTVILLENLRFHGAEEANQPEFCHALARFTDIYVSDAFGTAHRKHASTYGLPQLIAKKGAGFLIEKELEFLEPLLKGPAKPFYLVLGGSKVSDKIKMVDQLLKHVQGVLIGGAMAHAFTKAKGMTLPPKAKQPADSDVDCARTIMRDAERREIPLLLPVDTLEGFDIGPRTVMAFSDFLTNAKTIFWNGPLGWFENPEYASGTMNVAKAIAKIQAIKIVGGGDTVSAIKLSGVAESYNHLSTGGGAVLKYLEGKGLPGIDVLKFDPKRVEPAVLSGE